MFRESLLESAGAPRNAKRWPIAAAFAAEICVAAFLVAVPLLSTGVISVAARVPHPMALERPDLRQAPRPSASARAQVAHRLVVPIVTAALRSRIIDDSIRSSDPPEAAPPANIGAHIGIHDLPFAGPARPPELVNQKNKPPLVLSHLSEAQLLIRVEPVYPRIAIITHTEGEVRLHAIIAKDGSIQSLSVTSGVPILARAAIDAVRQWRYKPYYLNGEAVEVETIITVNFKKTND